METKEKQNSFHKDIISWEAPEYIQHEKGWKWFILAGLAVVLFGIYSVITSNWTLLIALVVLAALYFWQHWNIPKHVKIIVSSTGIKVGDTEYPYQNIKTFWIFYKPPHLKTLNLQSNSRFLPDIAVQLGDQDPGVRGPDCCKTST